MKPIQILIDEPLLRRLDADEDVRRLGRSEVLRRAADEYLRRRRSLRVTDAYRQAYGNKKGLSEEFAGWENEGSWPGK